MVSYFRVIVNPRDELAWKRILKMIPGIGKATANRIYESIVQRDADRSEPPALAGGESAIGDNALALVRSFGEGTQRDAFAPVSRGMISSLLEMLVAEENRNNPAKQIELILTQGYEQYLTENYENAESRVEDIAAWRCTRTDTNRRRVSSELALLSTERFKEPQPLVGEDVISGGEEDELLTLTSVHQAKGFEWKAVFIIWAAEGKFPSPRSLKEIDSEEEERRLWYVALTRAKDELYVTYPLMMTDYNRQTVLQKPSRFITECPPALFEIWNLEEETARPEIVIAAEPEGYLN